MHGVSAVLWPGVVVLGVLLFRQQLANLIQRITEFGVGGANGVHVKAAAAAVEKFGSIDSGRGGRPAID